MDNEIDQEAWRHVLGVVARASGVLSTASKELLGKGRDLADQLGVWLIIYDAEAADQGKEILSYGADLLLQRGSLRANRASAIMEEVDLLSNVIEKERPEIVLFTADWTAVAARLAQRFKTGLVKDCTALHLDPAERKLVATRPVYNGGLLEEYDWPTRRPQMAILKPGAFPEAFSDSYREGTVRTIDA